LPSFSNFFSLPPSAVSSFLDFFLLYRPPFHFLDFLALQRFEFTRSADRAVRPAERAHIVPVEAVKSNGSLGKVRLERTNSKSIQISAAIARAIRHML
jgi:hypothetical protein